jgi:hypothetical protein
MRGKDRKRLREVEEEHSVMRIGKEEVWLLREQEQLSKQEQEKAERSGGWGKQQQPATEGVPTKRSSLPFSPSR